MTKFLLDEMFRPAAAALLRDTYGHDAVHVSEVGLLAVEDALVAATARAGGRAVVTENVADYAAERDTVLVFVLKRNLAPGGAQAAGLAKILDRRQPRAVHRPALVDGCPPVAPLSESDYKQQT